MRKPFASLIDEDSLVLARREGPKISDKNPHSLMSEERVFRVGTVRETVLGHLLTSDAGSGVLSEVILNPCFATFAVQSPRSE